MKVALHLDGPRIRGSERQAVLLTRGLLARGHEVRVSCRADGPVWRAMIAAGAGVTAVRPRGDADVWSALRFSRWLRRERVEAVLLSSWKRVFIASWAARRAGVPRVMLRVGGLRGEGRGLGARVRRLAIRRWCDLVVVNSDMVRDQLLSDVPGLRAERVRVIPNGVAFEPLPAAPLRNDLGLDARDTLLLGVGGLEANKGLDGLVLAAAELDGRAHVVIAGAGPKDRIERLRALAAGAGMADRLHLLGHRRDVPALLAAADIFVLPSRADSLPNAMLEAMAAGVPAVMTAVGGVWEALGARDGRPAAGWVVPPDDTAALAACLRTLVRGVRSARSDIDDRVAEARWRAEHWYHVDRMVEDYEAVLMGRDV